MELKLNSASFELIISHVKSSQFNTLPKANSKTRNKQNKDMHTCSSVHSERGVPLPVLTSGENESVSGLAGAESRPKSGPSTGQAPASYVRVGLFVFSILKKNTERKPGSTHAH